MHREKPIGCLKKMDIKALIKKKNGVFTAMLALCSFFLSSPIGAQYLPVEEEAPEAILTAELGSADVDLFVTGSWEAALDGSVGLAFRKGIPPLLTQYPGMIRGAAFSQEPDLLLSLWIDQRYFFETSILAGYELNSLQTGYVNPDEGFLRQIILGVPAPPIESYGDALFSEGAKGSFGVSIETETDISLHNATLRIEDFGIKKKRYIGTKEISETVIHPAAYLRGRYFFLPDTEIDFIEIYEEVPANSQESVRADDGNYYAPLPKTAYRVSLSTGAVTLTEQARRRILVYYEKNGLPVGDPANGREALAGLQDGFPDPDANRIDFAFTDTGYLSVRLDELRVEIGAAAKGALLLYDPAAFSPFEDCGNYDAGFVLPEEQAEMQIEIGTPGAPLPGSEVDFLVSLFDPASFRIFNSSVESSQQPFRYPLASGFQFCYGPNARDGDNRVKERLLLIIRQDNEAFQLESPVAGSVIVRRNGFRETDFTVEQSGELIFDKPVSPGERIDVLYRTDSGEESTASLSFGLTNGFTIPGGLFAYITLAGNWNINPESYATTPDQYPGAIELHTGFELDREIIDTQADASLTVSTPDTTGVYRVFGGEENEAYFQVDEAAVFPSAAPSGFLEADRGILYYSDYVSYGVGGKSGLNRYDWSEIPPDQVFAYKNGNPTGPYAVSTTGDGVGSTAVALDFELEENGNWVGAQLPLSPGGEPPDLSRYEGIQFYWKYAPGDERKGSADDLEVYVQIGYLDEDIDGDGTLDAESSSFDSGFLFNDKTRNIRLTVGGRSDQPDFAQSSEDVNRNGVLDDEASSIVSRSFSFESAYYPESAWGQPVTLLFSEDERRRVRNASSWRIVVESASDEIVRNRLLVTGLAMLGSSFSTQPLAAGSVTASEKADTSLQESYPDIMSRFNPDGDPQKVTSFAWSGVDTTEGWTADGLSFGTPLADYKELCFFILGSKDTADTPRLTLNFDHSSQSALSVTFPLPKDNVWHRYSIDLASGNLTRDGEIIGSGEIDKSIAVIDSMSIRCTGSPSGVFLFDELHLSNTKLESGFSVQGIFSASSNDPILSAGDFPIIDKPRVEISALLTGNAVESGPSNAAARFSAVTGAEIAGAVAVTIEADADAGETFGLSGGHELSFPTFRSPVTITQRFRNYAEFEDNGYSHSLLLSGDMGGIVGMNIASDSSVDGDALSRDWSAGLDVFGRFPVSASADVSFSRLSTGYSPPANSYFIELADAFRLLSPVGKNGEFQRSASTEAELNASGETIAVVVIPSIGYKAVTGVQSLFSVDGEMSLNLPVSLRFDPSPGLKIEPYYTLELHRTSGGYTGNEVDDDLNAVAGVLSSQRDLYTVPVYDLFAPGLETIFSDSTTGSLSAEYKPTAGITISRSFGSYLRDLFIPAKLDIELQRSLLREEDSVTDTFSGGITLRATALNLFGSRGAYSRFSFYESDEYSWNTGVSAEFLSSELISYEILIRQLLFFTAGSETELSISNALRIAKADSLSWNGSLEPVFSWITPLPRGITLPLTDIELKKDVYFKHEESLALEFGGPSFLFAFLAGHSSELFLGDMGSARGVLHIGVSFENDTLLLGFEGGLRVKATF